MNTTISDQIKAIQEARKILAHPEAAKFLAIDSTLDAKLNDAGSSLAYINLSPSKELISSREEYFDQLVNVVCDYLESRDNDSELKERILSISYDRVVELENKVNELEKKLQTITISDVINRNELNQRF